jgi:WD40 repeat protein
MTIAHDGVIYSLQWDHSDTMVLTSSSDGTSKCWDVKNLMKMHLQRKNDVKRASLLMLTPSSKGADGAEETEVATVKLLFSCVHVPPVYVYSGVFSEATQHQRNVQANVRTLTGSHDGHIRVWENQTLVGYLSVANVESDSDVINDNQPPAHPGKITCLVIDERTKYLVSADRDGLVLIWKYYFSTKSSPRSNSRVGEDAAWYRVLRKLRTELCASPITTVTSLALTHNSAQSGAGAASATGAPPSQLMVFAPPNQLVSFSMSNFRPTTSFPGVRTTPLEYHRTTLSPDGRFVCACVLESSSESAGNTYSLKIWDVISGGIVQNTMFSHFTFPYLIRSVTWHPTQHMIAVSSLGPNAAVMVFYTEKESAKKAARRLSTLNIADVYNAVNPAEDAMTSDGASEKGSVTGSVAASVHSRTSTALSGAGKPLFTINEASATVGSVSSSLGGTGKTEANSELLKRLRAKRQAASALAATR